MKGRNLMGAIGGLALGLLLVAAVGAQPESRNLHLSPNLMPKPELTPEQVVQIQLNALRLKASARQK